MTTNPVLTPPTEPPDPAELPTDLGEPSATDATRAADATVLDEPLPPIRHRRRLGPLTLALALVFTAAAGLAVGTALGRHSADGGGSTSGGASSAAAASFRGGGSNAGTGRGGVGGGSSGPSAGQSGTVKLVDGNKVYVAGADGSISTFTIENDTRVSQTQPVHGDALAAGQSVTVTPNGSPDADGVTKAQTIVIASAAVPAATTASATSR